MRNELVILQRKSLYIKKNIFKDEHPIAKSSSAFVEIKNRDERKNLETNDEKKEDFEGKRGIILKEETRFNSTSCETDNGRCTNFGLQLTISGERENPN
ncbi:hypothetical protein [Alkalihalobacterium alkalinitrilicum]|uniref:hypothetical protein n=1 Tax=Alkalihalobacterium alkalinitrilicum TaxID=427920 RepID=UPI001C591908|nr:hypothetical protein [Alkalihalobacterium alkalinitrilicum]